MKTYKIYCNEGERAEVMRILRKYSDVIINNVDSQGFVVTIQTPHADAFYERLMDEIGREVFRYRREYHSRP